MRSLPFHQVDFEGWPINNIVVSEHTRQANVVMPTPQPPWSKNGLRLHLDIDLANLYIKQFFQVWFIAYNEFTDLNMHHGKPPISFICMCFTISTLVMFACIPPQPKISTLAYAKHWKHKLRWLWIHPPGLTSVAIPLAKILIERIMQ